MQFSDSNFEEYSMGYLGYAMAVAMVALKEGIDCASHQSPNYLSICLTCF